MTDAFDDREKALENLHAKDEEGRFRQDAQAVRLFALWAAGQIGLTNEAAQKYANSLADVHVTKKGLQHVTAKVKADFAAMNVETSDHHLENQLRLHLAEAGRAQGK